MVEQFVLFTVNYYFCNQIKASFYFLADYRLAYAIYCGHNGWNRCTSTYDWNSCSQSKRDRSEGN